MRDHTWRQAVLWALFFLICMGLGYPTLNRYDARRVPGLYDARAYYALVTGSPLQQDQSDLAHRVLVPWLARPVFRLAAGHLHTWDPAFFGLLVVNSFFSATTAALIVLLGRSIAGDNAAAMLGGFVYLLSFAVANLNLSAYVDSAVNCILMAIVWSVFTQRWWLLPVWGVIGAFAKETFLPLAVVLAFAWWLAESNSNGVRKPLRLVWASGMGIVGFLTLMLLMSRVSPPNSPWNFATSRWNSAGSGFLYLTGLADCVLAREFLFTFGWLLPLGLWRLKALPRPWVVGAACSAALALAFGAYDDACGNAARAVFSAIGPPLSLSTGLLLAQSSVAQPSSKPAPRSLG